MEQSPGRNWKRIRHISAALLAAGAVSTPGASYAQDSRLAACLAIPEMAARVACYDAIARDDAARGATPRQQPNPRVQSRAPVATPANPREEFGLNAAERESRRPTEQQQLERLTFRVASARPVSAGYWQFTMDDGSVWQLTEVRRAFRPAKPGSTVEVRRAALGSYFLLTGGQEAMRVKRLK
jgi:hypothetical protein